MFANREKVLICALGVLLFAWLTTPRLEAQGTTAAIQGTITDISGASVPDAAVQVKNVGTGAAQSTTTDGAGRFRVPDLSVGNYDVQATKMGFSTVVRAGITLTVGAQTVVDFALPVGQQTQTVTVEGQASQVETTNATVGSLTDQTQMRELPLNGRNFEQLILLAPGVQSISAFQSLGFEGRANEYSIAGSRPTGQGIYLDDENLQNFWNKGMGSVTGSSLGVEAIGEFQTLTNTYTAQFGGNGGVINAVSKSGTNSPHGSAFEFLRNSALDARSFIDGANVPEFRRNQFGGSVGGPVKRDKAFFFVNYEGVRQALGETKVAFVPDCTASNAFTGGACTPSASLPAASRQSIINTLKIFPSPNPGTVVAGIGKATPIATQTAHENYFLGRFDYNLSAKDAVFLRYISDRSDFLEPFGGGGFGGGQLPFWPETDNSQPQFATLEERHIFSPTLINMARISFSRPNQYGNTIASTPPLQFFPGSGRVDGLLTIGGLSGMGGASPVPFIQIQNRYTEADDLTMTRGAHTLKLGMAFVRLQSNTFLESGSGSRWTFQGMAQFLGGQPQTLAFPPLVLRNGLPVYGNRDYREIELLPYVQEDWKIHPKLTLNLGLRWEFATNAVETHNQLYNITDFSTSTAFTNVPHVMRTNPSWHNFAPRFGFAYDPFANHKTSIRGGFGIFYDPVLPSVYAPVYWNTPPFQQVQVGLGVQGTVAPFYPNIPATGSSPLPSTTTGFDWNNNTTPYMMQYNFNIQREIAQGTIVTLGYVGSRGVHLMSQIERNPASRSIDSAGVEHFAVLSSTNAVVPNPRLNRLLSTFQDMIPTAWSRYNSMQATMNRRMTRSAQAQVSYTYSKCIDNGGNFGSYSTNSPATYENPYNANLDKSACVYDVTHVLSVNGLVALPFHGNRLVEGWQISEIVRATSGTPFTVTDGVDASGVGAGTRPNVNVGCTNNPVVGNPNHWFNTSCFSLAPLTTLGNLGRNTVRGPHYTAVDFALLKGTKIRENLNLQFRAEFFNIFNHANYGLPSGALFTSLVNGVGNRNPNADVITTQLGTPRQIQFGLKLVF
jgi:hypothetical protein